MDCTTDKSMREGGLPFIQSELFPQSRYII